MELVNKTKQEIIESFGKDATDTGSVEVQCALITSRIKNLEKHFKSNHNKDNQSRRGLLALVYQRRKLLKYLKAQDENRYKDLIKKLGLRK